MPFHEAILKAIFVAAMISKATAESSDLLESNDFWSRHLSASVSLPPVPPPVAPVRPPVAPIPPPVTPVPPPLAPVPPPVAPVPPPVAPVRPPVAPVPPPVAPVPPPSPPNVCLLEAGIACVVPGTSQQCSALEGERDLVCRCNDCASELDFRYTATKCSAADTAANICRDFGAEPLPSRAKVFVAFGAAVFFDGEVGTNQDTVLTPGLFTNGTSRCLTNEVRVNISDTSGTLRQQLTINTRCRAGDGAGNFLLLDDQGALTFSGYVCRENPSVRNQCFVPVRYDVTARNTGPTQITVTDFTFTFEGVTSSVASNTPLGAGATLSRSQPAEIGLCKSDTFDASTRVTAVNNLGTQCPAAEARSTTTITVVPARPVPAPISPPIAAPVVAPVPAPIAAPVVAPVPAPVLPPVAAKTGMMQRLRMV
jgi:hypothetical protein